MSSQSSPRISLEESKAPFLQEWDHELNFPTTPADIAPKTKVKFWWKCSVCSFSWSARVEARWRQGCPECGKRKNLANRRRRWLEAGGTFESQYPELASQWHPSNTLSPSDVSPGSSMKITWSCTHGHTWATSIQNRIKAGVTCPFCNGSRLYEKGLPEELVKQLVDVDGALNLSEIKQGSRRKLWWKCDLGHKWLATVHSRLRRGTECPACNRSVATETNNLTTANPELMRDWDFEKNRSVLPENLLAGSGKKVWWKCSQGHSWKTKVNERKRGRGCPYCSNNLVCATNNLAVLYPSISKSWHSVKNQGLDPSEVLPGSARKVWWICSKGHSWRSTILSRTSGTGCPHCRPQTSKPEVRLYCELKEIFSRVEWRKKIQGSESDVTLPNLKVCIEVDGYPWHSNKLLKDIEKTKKFEALGYKVIRLRDTLLPEIPGIAVTYNNREPLGPSIREVVARILSVTNVVGEERERCSRYLASASFWGDESFERAIENIDFAGNQPSFFDKFPGLVAEWDESLNQPKDPKFFLPGSTQKVWWRCSRNHKWKASIKQRTSRQTGCPYCRGSLTTDERSLQALYPELAQEYSAENLYAVGEISHRSSRKVKWQCGTCNFVFSARTADRVAKGSGCPACAGKVPRVGESLSSLFPDLMVEWDHAGNNGLDPEMLLPGSHKVVFWQCKLGHRWKTAVRNRTQKGIGSCPECKKTLKTS